MCMFSYTCKIMFDLTLWQIKQEVYNQVESYITTADKVEALQSQLRFGKAVLEQKVPTKDWFTFTEVQEGKPLPLTVMELTNNFKQLFDSAVQNLNILIHRRVKYKFMNVTDDSKEWYNGRILSHAKREIPHDTPPSLLLIQLLSQTRLHSNAAKRRRVLVNKTNNKASSSVCSS